MNKFFEILMAIESSTAALRALMLSLQAALHPPVTAPPPVTPVTPVTPAAR